MHGPQNKLAVAFQQQRRKNLAVQALRFGGADVIDAFDEDDVGQPRDGENIPIEPHEQVQATPVREDPVAADASVRDDDLATPAVERLRAIRLGQLL
ncbi:hypothetical protein ACRAWD_13705 [Caulobacter segnis]